MGELLRPVQDHERMKAHVPHRLYIMIIIIIIIIIMMRARVFVSADGPMDVPLDSRSGCPDGTHGTTRLQACPCLGWFR